MADGRRIELSVGELARLVDVETDGSLWAGRYEWSGVGQLVACDGDRGRLGPLQPGTGQPLRR